MHNNKAYSIEESEDTILKIIKPLRTGTEIEELLVDKYNALKSLVQDRIVSLAQEMLDVGILERGGENKLQRSAAFDSVWKDREIYWKRHEPAPAMTNPPSKPMAASVESYDSNGSDDEVRRDTNLRTASAKSVEKQNRISKVNPANAISKSNNSNEDQAKTPLVSPVRRTVADIYDGPNDTDIPEHCQHKRHKSNLVPQVSIPDYPDTPSPGALLSPTPTADDEMEIDTQQESLQENLNFGEV